MFLEKGAGEGIWLRRLVDSSFRHPRFNMLDTVEDKGMEIQRGHNLQLLIADVSKNLVADHQIIFATSMIAPDLDTEDYTVGKTLTRDDQTLDLPWFGLV